MPSKETPLSVGLASEETGIPARTIRYAITAGHLKAQKLPGRTGSYLIDRRDFDRWITRREMKASA
jgi:excisionase family DNA binding protein